MGDCPSEGRGVVAKNSIIEVIPSFLQARYRGRNLISDICSVAALS